MRQYPRVYDKATDIIGGKVIVNQERGGIIFMKNNGNAIKSK